MLSTFLIALREGTEACLIISILIAYLIRSGRRASLPAIYTGTGLAIALSFGLGAFLSFTSHELSPRGEQVFAGVTSLAAVLFVTVMVFWMKQSARGLGKELQGRIDHALPLGAFALISAAFFAVAREGLETALFIYSNFKTVHSNTAPSIGLTLGLITAVILGVALYRKSIKLNLGKFFQITGIALIVVAGGVLSHGVAEFQALGVLPGSNSFAWNFGNSGASSHQLLSTILDGTIGISYSLTWLQFAIWFAYLAVVIALYRRPASTPLAVKPGDTAGEVRATAHSA